MRGRIVVARDPTSSELTPPPLPPMSTFADNTTVGQSTDGTGRVDDRKGTFCQIWVRDRVRAWERVDAMVQG